MPRSRRVVDLMEEALDAKVYYLLDARGVVGNCAYWWAPDAKGYVCTIDKAGLYSLRDARDRRDTDIPIHMNDVERLAVRHVRLDHLRRDGLVDRELAFDRASERVAAAQKGTQ